MSPLISVKQYSILLVVALKCEQIPPVTCSYCISLKKKIKKSWHIVTYRLWYSIFLINSDKWQIQRERKLFPWCIILNVISVASFKSSGATSIYLAEISGYIISLIAAEHKYYLVPVYSCWQKPCMLRSQKHRNILGC